MPPTLDVVIVNWNAGPLLDACVSSLARTDQSTCTIDRIVVVDNMSVDGSADGLAASPIELIRNPSNLGFAAACNQGARGSTTDYLLFLNPDIRLFENSLRGPVVFMEEPGHQDVGICGVRLVDHRGRPAYSAWRFPTVKTFLGEMTGLSRVWSSAFPPHALNESECRETRTVDQVMGAFFLVRRTLFESLGGFDERFFMYFEDVDFSRRARQAGMESVLIGETTAVHYGGQSSSQVRAARLFYSLQSRFRYAFKHFSPVDAATLVILTLTIEFCARLAVGLVRLSPADVANTLRAYVRLSRELT